MPALSKTGTSAASELPFVSVVLPCYNNLATVGDCLTGLLKQSYPRERFEIIVADNGSRDGSCDLIRHSFPGVNLVYATQKGSAYARNAGVAQASGSLILSTDADCVADPGWIEALVDAMRSAPQGTAAVGGAILPHTARTLVERYKRAWVSQPPADGDIRYTATPNAIYSADILRTVGGFDGTAGHDDSDLGIRLRKAGYQVSFTDAARVYHRNPVRLGELYRHRQKYGQANFILAGKHPDLFGDPRGPQKRRQLFLETVRRVVGNLVKFPFSLLRQAHGRPRGWPLVDAVMALGNYNGFARASRAADRAQL